MPITVFIQGTSIGTDTGPFSIYYTSVDPANLLIAGVTRPQITTGLTFSNVPDGTNDFYLVSSGICANQGTATLILPTNAPTASPTAAPTAAPVTPAPTPEPTAAPVTPSPTAEPTAAPVTPAPATPAPVTPEPTAAPVTPAPILATESPVTPAPVTPAPVTPAPVTPAPVTPAPQLYASPVTPSPVTPAPVTPAPVPEYNFYTATLCTTGEAVVLRTQGTMMEGSVYDIDGSGTCVTATGLSGGPGYDLEAFPEPVGGGGCESLQCVQATPAPATPSPVSATYIVWEVCAGPNYGELWYANQSLGYGIKGYANQDSNRCAYVTDSGLSLAEVESSYPTAQVLFNGFTPNTCPCE